MKFLQASAIYAVANIASAAVPFLLLPILTRALAPDDFGAVVAFSLLVMLCMPLAGVSVHSAVGVGWFNRPRDEIPQFNGAAIVVGMGTTLLTTGLLAAAVASFPPIGLGISPAWAATAALTAGATVLLQCRLVLWQSQARPFQYAALQFGSSAINVGLSLVAVLVLGMGGDGRNLSFALAAVASAVLAVGLLLGARDAVWCARRAHITFLFGYGVPLVPHVLAGVALGTADRWIVSAQFGTATLGFYGAAAQVGMVMATLVDAFVKAFNPWIYARLASPSCVDHQRATGAMYVAIPAFLAMGLVVGVALYWASTLLLGPRYHAASGLLPWFVLGGACSGIYLCTSGVFFFSGRTLLLSSITLTAATLGTAATWLLASRFGTEGAAMGYAATQALLALFANVAVRAHFDLPWREPIKVIGVWARHAFDSPARQAASWGHQ